MRSDTGTLGQIRSGAVDFFTLSGLILSTLVPAAAINGVGFAFEKIWDNGLRQTTTSTKPIQTPEDLDRLRVVCGLTRHRVPATRRAGR